MEPTDPPPTLSYACFLDWIIQVLKTCLPDLRGATYTNLLYPLYSLLYFISDGYCSLVRIHTLTTRIHATQDDGYEFGIDRTALRDLLTSALPPARALTGEFWDLHALKDQELVYPLELFAAIALQCNGLSRYINMQQSLSFLNRGATLDCHSNARVLLRQWYTLSELSPSGRLERAVVASFCLPSSFVSIIPTTDCCVSTAPRDKAGFFFDMFDFGEREEASYDEVAICISTVVAALSKVSNINHTAE